MARIAIGELKSVVKFEKNEPTLNDTGRKVDNYVEFLTTRGRLRNINGYRQLEGYQADLVGKWELVTRHQPALENNVWKSMRVVVDGNRFFSLESIEVIKEVQKTYYKFILNENTSA